MKCNGTTKGGTRCQNHAMRSSYCSRHDPARIEFRNARKCLKILNGDGDLPPEMLREAGADATRQAIIEAHSRQALDGLITELERIKGDFFRFFP